jgi:general secretion pathway protein J
LIPPNKRTSGFTLLEVIMAISIFALIGIGSYTLLSRVIESEEVSTLKANKLANLQLAFSILQQDFLHLQERIHSDAKGKLSGSFQANTGASLLEFLRGGWNNSFGASRSDLRKVSYVLISEKKGIDRKFLLQRRVYADANEGGQSTADPQQNLVLEQVLFEDATDISFQFMTRDGKWVREWSIPEQTVAAEHAESEEIVVEEPNNFPLPAAIQLTVDYEDYGEITRLFETASGMPVRNLQTDTNSNE